MIQNKFYIFKATVLNKWIMFELGFDYCYRNFVFWKWKLDKDSSYSEMCKKLGVDIFWNFL